MMLICSDLHTLEEHLWPQNVNVFLVHGQQTHTFSGLMLMGGKTLKLFSAWKGELPYGEGENWEQKLNHAKHGCLIWHDALVWSLEVVSGFLVTKISALKMTCKPNIFI